MNEYQKRVAGEVRRLKRLVTPAEAYRALALHRVAQEMAEVECPLDDCCQSEPCKKFRKVEAALKRAKP